MQRFTLLLTFLFLLFINVSAQNRGQKKDASKAFAPTAVTENRLNVRGTVYENESLDPIEGAQVKLLDKDGKVVGQAVTQKSGQYLLANVLSGTYKISITMMSYKEQSFSLTLPKKSGNYKVADVLLRDDAKMLAETVVEGKLPEMTVADDTIVYNADAFKLPDGALVEELIKKLPGIVVEDDGGYSFNGKRISQLLVDGKEFFGNNMELILKNFPAEIVEKLKAYERKSDMARITGIDDGNERTVLDLQIKKNRKRGWFGNAEGSYGTRERYNGRLNVNRFVGDNKFSVTGNGGNTGGNGMNNSQQAGATMNLPLEKVELNGSISGNFGQGKSQSWSNSQNFELSSPRYSNNHNWSGNNNKSFNFQYRTEWKPDSTWNILFRPEFSYSGNSSHNDSHSAQFRKDPYSFLDNYESDDPLEIWDRLSADIDSMGINHRRSGSRNSGHNLNASGSVQINKRLQKPGRNVTLNLSGSYGNSENESSSYSQTDYLQSIANSLGVMVDDSIYHKVQFNRNPSMNYNLSAQLSYSEPIATQTYLQVSYRVNYRFTDNQRNIRSIFDITQPEGMGLLYSPFGSGPGEININSYRDFYDSPYVVDDTLQMGYTTNKYVNQDIRAQIRFNRTKFQLTVGGNVQPQYNAIDYKKGSRHVQTSRNVVNASPTVNFRYMFSRQEQLNFRYNGNTGQPSITDMIPGVLSDNDPLNIRYGNPDLKPSFTQSINFDYSRNVVDYQRSNSINVQFRTTQNSTANRTEYNEETGGRVSMPVNVNGNWSGSVTYNFNTALGPKKYWRISTGTSGNMGNNIGYQYNSKKQETVRTQTRNSRINQSLRLTYRRDWESGWQMEANTNGNFSYSINRSTNPNATNLDIKNFGYGFSTNITTPWGMTFNTNVSENSRRGYSDKNANTNRWIWNATLSQRLLKSKALTLSLRAVDILNQRDDINRNVGATSRTDSHSEMVSSYVLFSVNLRFGKFGGRGMGNRGGRPEGGGERGGERGGNNGGNGGGGRGFGGPGGGAGAGGGRGGR